jgi:hypothetical protein
MARRLAAEVAVPAEVAEVAVPAKVAVLQAVRP